jgi:hypothetical protein
LFKQELLKSVKIRIEDKWSIKKYSWLFKKGQIMSVKKKEKAMSVYTRY